MACKPGPSREERLAHLRALVSKGTIWFEERAVDDYYAQSKAGPQVYSYQIDSMRLFDTLIPRMQQNEWGLDQGYDWSDFFKLSFDDIKVVYEFAKKLWSNPFDSGYTPKYDFSQG